MLSITSCTPKLVEVVEIGYIDVATGQTATMHREVAGRDFRSIVFPDTAVSFQFHTSVTAIVVTQKGEHQFGPQYIDSSALYYIGGRIWERPTFEDRTSRRLGFDKKYTRIVAMPNGTVYALGDDDQVVERKNIRFEKAPAEQLEAARAELAALAEQLSAQRAELERFRAAVAAPASGAPATTSAST